MRGRGNTRERKCKLMRVQEGEAKSAAVWVRTLRKCGFYAISGIKVAEYRYDDVTARDTLIQIYYRRACALFIHARSFGARARNAHKKLTLSLGISAIGKIRRCFCCCRYYLLLHACTTSFQSSLIICDALYFAARQGYTTRHTRRVRCWWCDFEMCARQNAKMNVLLKMCIKYVKHLGHDSRSQDPLCVLAREKSRAPPLLYSTYVSISWRRSTAAATPRVQNSESCARSSLFANESERERRRPSIQLLASGERVLCCGHVSYIY